MHVFVPRLFVIFYFFFVMSAAEPHLLRFVDVAGCFYFKYSIPVHLIGSGSFALRLKSEKCISMCFLVGV